ncbi:MAG: SCP2 sterol-binding domain-containing protein [Candidatus Bathyarchaeota archaeon]|nr:SCP2 sterol-binding domain-containing protein [Candidatus Termiticorpusculum sp.]
MDIKTAQEFFTNTLPARFKQEKSKDIEVIVQVNLTGSNPSDWVVVIRDQKIQATQRISTEPTLTLKISESDFLDLVNDRLSVEKAFFSGKVNFKGDITVALKLKEAGFLSGC